MPLSRRFILVGAVLLLSGYTVAPALGQADGFPSDGLSSASSGGGSDASPSAKLHPTLLRELDESDEPVKAWVFFTDKGVGSQRAYDQAIQRVASNYNRRAIQRRMLRGTSAARGGAVFNEHDLPVVQVYVDAVVATGARRHVTSTWVNAVSVYGTRKQFEEIAALPFVAKLQPVARRARIIPPEPDKVSEEQSARLPEPAPPGAERGTDVRGLIDYGASEEQLAQINLIALHNEGYTGDGVIVGILDTGFHRSHIAFTNPYHRLNIVAEWDFVDNDANTDIDPGDPDGQHSHGTMILGCLGAYEPGGLVGGAYDAAFILCKTEDVTDEDPEEEDNFVAGLQLIEANGGDMATSSLGYIDWYTQGDLDGLTAVTTVAVNIATDNGVHCCTAAGNAGHDSNPVTSSLIAPSDAFEVITCGAVYSSGGIASFSSNGPSADGRVKPEVLARGVSTHTVSPYTVDTYTTANGTSLSTPLVASAVACLIQANPQWTVEQMRDHLFNTAGDYVANGTYDPLHIRGYGVINAHLAYADCNISGLADECDVDCGTPGGPCDVPGCGGSLDCNANSVPD
ncbi:MAG: S8 family serine peptidase, partial [Planctomycetota bacterium]